MVMAVINPGVPEQLFVVLQSHSEPVCIPFKVSSEATILMLGLTRRFTHPKQTREGLTDA